jgi:tetratricopeptide (TPR) repeat protein
VTDPAKILQQRNAEIQQIEGYVDLNDEAKNRRITEVTEKANASYQEAKEAEARRIEERVTSTRKAVYGVPASPMYSDAEVAQTHHAFRTAWDDVLFQTHDTFAAQEELEELLEGAERRGDALFARAVYHRALDLGLQQVVGSYLSTRPREAKALERYRKALAEAEQARSVEGLLASAMIERQLGG